MLFFFKNLIRLAISYKLSILGINKRNLIRYRNPQSFISSRVSIIFNDYSQILIGKNTSIHDYTLLIAINDRNNHLNNSKLIIGNNTYIGEFNNIRAGGGLIKIGNYCSISQHVSILASNHKTSRSSYISKQEWDTEKNYVEIEDDVWIGANSVILPGVKIGKGAVVGAGCVVTKDIPPYAIVVGNPAKVLKYRV